MLHIPDTSASDNNEQLDELIGTWWLINTDVGHTYAVVKDWRRAFNRIDYIVTTFGDTADSNPIQPLRFIRLETPPLANLKAGPKVDLDTVDVGTKQHTVEQMRPNPKHRRLRKADDPMAQALAAEAPPKRKKVIRG